MKPLVVTLAVGLLMLVATPSAAQFYDNSLGLRLGTTSAMTYKRFIAKEQALELLVSGRKDGFQLTTLYEFHRPTNLNISKNIFFYYGVGAHIGYVKEYVDQYRLNSSIITVESNRETLFTMGVNTVIGVEYRWLVVPMTIGADLKPFFEFIGMRETEFTIWDAAISIKYVF